MLVMPPGARRISSRMTAFHKRVFPPIWFGLLVIFMLIGLVTGRSQPMLLVPMVGVPALLMVFGYLLMRFMIFDLMDEVWDNGSELIALNEGHAAHIPLRNIVNVNCSLITNPKRATLLLRNPCRWGTRITFSPVWCFSMSTGLNSPVIDELIQRVDQARRETENSANSASASR